MRRMFGWDLPPGCTQRHIEEATGAYDETFEGDDVMTTYTTRDPKWSLIPDGMVGSVQRYIEHGVRPGHFLSAVLSNDLREAAARADEENRVRLADYVMFFNNYAPSECWGSHEKMQVWIARGGLAGG